MHLSPTITFYLLLWLSAVAIAAVAVMWDRWYIRRLLIKEFVRQLHLEQQRREGDTVEVFLMKRG